MRAAVLSSPRLRYRLATFRANLSLKKSSQPRGSQQQPATPVGIAGRLVAVKPLRAYRRLVEVDVAWPR